MKEFLKNRYNILGLFLILSFAAILFRLFDMQIVNGESYDLESQRRILNNKKITAPRGNIVDRNGIPIAVNRMGYNIQITKTSLKDKDLNEMLLNLMKVFEKNGNNYNKSFTKYLQTTNNTLDFGSALSKVDEKERQTRIIKEFGLKPKTVFAASTPADVLKFLRSQVYKIDDKYTDDEAYKIILLRYEIRGYTKLNAICVAKDASKETVAEIEEQHDRFPGVSVDISYVRKYIDAQPLSHVLGYIGKINDDEYKKLKDDGYSMDSYVGKSGVELAAENYLRGKDVIQKIEVDTTGKITDVLDNENITPGDDVGLTIDTHLQKTAMESLERNINVIKNMDMKGNFKDADAGAVVAMDVHTGEILAMASYPSYDPSLFLEDSSNKEARQAVYDILTNSQTRPAFNRAISGTYAPGSTFKPLVGIAGLEEGVIGPSTLITDNGFVYYDGMKFTCMEFRHGLPAHGSINLSKALATSCNIYFHELGVSLGIDNIVKWAKEFGLGQKTGIDVDPGAESKGTLSGKEFKKKLTKDIWSKADTAQSSIGQLYNSFTPLQLVDYISTVANGGKRYKPFIIKKVIAPDGSIAMEKQPEFHQINLKPETVKAVKDGMIAVANSEDGTAVDVFQNFGYQVAAKTGTAETGNESKSNNSIFVCYAPADNPQIAVAVVIEHGVFGKFGAPVARDIMAEYFNVNNNISDSIKADNVVFSH